MSDLIESNPDILGGKPIIKGTRIPVSLIYELIGLNYSVEEIQAEYPHLDRDILLKILELGNDALKNLSQVNIDEIIIKRKGGKVRSVPLNPTALKIITKQPKKDRFIFDIPNRAQPSLLVRTINQVKKKTGIKQFHFHLLRHYFTTSLVEKGADFITISKILGHSKLTTSFVYSHTNKERKRRAVDLLI